MSDSVAIARTSLAAGMFKDTVYILRTALQDDGGGGTYPDPAGPTVYGPFPGAFSRLSGQERLAAAQLGQHGEYRLAMGTALRDPTTSVLIVPAETDQVAYQEKIYNVTWAPPLTALNLSRVMLLSESGASWSG